MQKRTARTLVERRSALSATLPGRAFGTRGRPSQAASDRVGIRSVKRAEIPARMMELEGLLETALNLPVYSRLPAAP